MICKETHLFLINTRTLLWFLAQICNSRKSRVILVVSEIIHSFVIS